MNLKEMIYKRKSTRSYTGVPVDEETLQRIRDFTAQLKPLSPEIKVCSEIVEKGDIKCVLPWTTPQLIAVYSENKNGMLENVGFMYQQLDLYLQSMGLGVCWLGMGRMKNNHISINKDNNLEFVIMLAFGYPKGDALRSNKSEFRRSSLSEISDRPDERLESARVAPSSVNSQPWYFTHDGDIIHAYCVQKGLFGVKSLGDMNLIDMGIALAHIYVENPDTFRFFKAENAAAIKGYGYIGSFTI